MDECSTSLLARDDSQKYKLPTMAREIINADSIGSSEKNLETVKDELIDSLGKKLDADPKKIPDRSIPCIHSVRERLRKKKESAYSPYVISIGPHYYKHNKLLEGKEVHKINYMHCLFKRTVSLDEEAEIEKVARQKMKECVDAIAIQETVAKARSSYALSFPQYNDAKFIEILIVDGCFILELLWKFDYFIQYRKKVDPVFGEYLLLNDVFFDKYLVLNDVAHDLLLLENQIPFSVLKTLFEATLKQIENPPPQLPNLILQFFSNYSILNLDQKLEISEEQETGGVTHILGLFHMCLAPSPDEPNGDEENLEVQNGDEENLLEVQNGDEENLEVQNKKNLEVPKYSATDLYRSGVNIMPCKGANMKRLCGKKNPSEIPKFCVVKPNRSCCFVSWFCQLFGKTRLAITPLCIYDETESVLRNLIAYEKYYQCAGNHITSYAFLMDTLIDDEDDVKLLESKGVLKNNLGAPREAVDLFNNLCKEVDVEPFLFRNQWNQVVKYRRSIWPRNIAFFKRTYFNTPWSGIAFIVGLFITICQFIVTFKSLGFLQAQSLLKYE